MKKGMVYLIPTVISENTQSNVIGAGVRNVLPAIRYFLVENVRTARRFLSSLKVYESVEPLHFEVLDKDTPVESLDRFFEPVLKGEDVGILSESGCPGVADPGALAVEYAHRQGLKVVPMVGPSSILLGLMASGLNGQRFAFHGYLPIDARELANTIRELERESRQKNQTQIFIETPYRNNTMMSALLRSLNPSTLLTVALDLTGEGESIQTHPAGKWKILSPQFSKTPAVFLFLA